MKKLKKQLQTGLCLLGLLSLLLTNVAFASNRLDEQLIRKVVENAISNLELNPELHRLDALIFANAIESQLHLTAASLNGHKPKDQVFYGIGAYFIAKHFGREAIAEAILLEERRFAEDFIFKSWIDAELLKIQRKRLLKNVGVFGKYIGLNKIPVYEEGNNGIEFESLFKPLESGKTLYSEKLEENEYRKFILAGEALRSQAEDLAGEGKLKTAIQKLDYSTKLIARVHKNTENYFGPFILTARMLNDLGQPFAAIIRYKQLSIELDSTNYNIWKAIVEEDLGDVYLELEQNQMAKISYLKAKRFFEGKQDSIERLNNKLERLED